MRRCLVVANRTLLSAELQEELRQRIESGPSSFYVLVPNTSAADYQIPADSGVLPPSLAWWATNYRGPATDEEASAQARQRLGQTLADLTAHGAAAEGGLGEFRAARGDGEGSCRSPVRRDHRGHAAPAHLALARDRPAPSGRAEVQAPGHDRHHEALTRAPPPYHWLRKSSHRSSLCSRGVCAAGASQCPTRMIICGNLRHGHQGFCGLSFSLTGSSGCV